MSQVMNGYRLLAPLSNDASGNGKWGFAVKDGFEVFIKEFLTPVYPVNAAIFTEERRKKIIEDCIAFQERKKRLYREINSCKNGVIVIIIDFFRYDSKYYVVSEKIEKTTLSLEELSRLDWNQKILLLKMIAKSVSDLHSRGVVHADLKPDNILFKRTRSGLYTARIIDFDSSFLEKESPSDGEVEGDLLYLAPETFRKMNGESVRLTRQIDVFSLGLIFYQLLLGKMPFYPAEKYDYPFEAVLDGVELIPDNGELPRELADILKKMLNPNPAKRYSLAKVVKKLEKLSRSK